MSDPITYTAGMPIESNAATLEETGEGTLGCFARALGTNRSDGLADQTPVLLTCAHFLYPRFTASPNVAVYQPSYSTCCSGARIARTVVDTSKDAWGTDEHGNLQYISGFSREWMKVANSYGGQVFQWVTKTDCAIAPLLPGIMWRNEWRYTDDKGAPQVIPITGAVNEVQLNPGPPLGTAPTSAQYVRVLTRDGRLVHATLLPHKASPEHPTEDRIELADGWFRMYYEWPLSDVTYEQDQAAGAFPVLDQYLLFPRPAPTPGVDYKTSYLNASTVGFSRGDSGTIVIDHQGRVIAQLVRIVPKSKLEKSEPTDAMEWEPVTSIGVATPIHRVLDKLKIEIPSAPAGWSGTVPARGATQARSVHRALRADVSRLRDRLHASRRGRLLLGKIVEHRAEVRRLFATVRAITAAWRELDGPAFFHHCVRSVGDAAHVIPDAVNGHTRAQLVDVLLPLIVRHASPALRRDIERYRAWALATLFPIRSLSEVPERVAWTWHG